MLALLAAGLWGFGDFSGGMAVKRAGGTVPAALRVILTSHAASFCILVTIALSRGDAFPHGAPLFWALGCGFTGAFSLTAFYIALSRGAMGAAAAVSGLLAAAIPSAVAMGSDGMPGWQHGLGFAIAGVAIWLIAGGTTKPQQESRATIGLAALAGAGFGIYFIALKYAGAGGLVWPMAMARVGSLTTASILLGIISVRSHTAPIPLQWASARWALSTTLFDTTGNLAFMAATQMGRLDVAAVLASLYPASTILLAAGLLKERPTAQQWLGMGAAGAAVVMITLG